MWAEKEPHLKEPPMVFHASSRSHHLSKPDEQLSFTCLTSASTPSKSTSGPHPQSVSSDSRHSMTPFATECQTLGSELAKWFQILCGIEASHRMAAQATTHEIVLSGCQAHSAAYGVATATQQAKQQELTLCRLHEEANKV